MRKKIAAPPMPVAIPFLRAHLRRNPCSARRKGPSISPNMKYVVKMQPGKPPTEKIIVYHKVAPIRL